MILAADYAWLTGQSPFGKAPSGGGHVHMLNIMKDHREALGIPASEVQMDSTIARTRRLLQHQTLDLDLDLEERSADTAFFSLRLTNRAGHRFPSGYPRAGLHHLRGPQCRR